MHHFIFGFIFISSIVLADAGPQPLCQREVDLSGLAVTTCQLPSCPTGGDCAPPEIDRTAGYVDFQPPLIKWVDLCPVGTLQRSCWEISLDLNFIVQAKDESGIAAVGVNLVTEADGERKFQKIWGVRMTESGEGVFKTYGNLRTFSPPGQAMQASVYQLCAKDKLGNEGCVFPRKAATLSLLK